MNPELAVLSEHGNQLVPKSATLLFLGRAYERALLEAARQYKRCARRLESDLAPWSSRLILQIVPTDRQFRIRPAEPVDPGKNAATMQKSLCASGNSSVSVGNPRRCRP